MMPIKIECGCGQHYAFDVEPVDGQMPIGIVCPGCGGDGTITANEIISRQLRAQTIAASQPNTLRIPAHLTPSQIATPTTIAPTPPRRTLLPGQVNRDQAEREARAKAMWGDSKDEVIKYLMMQGFSHPEAFSVVEAVFNERANEVRANGIRKIVSGAGMMCVPVIAFIIFAAIGIFLLKIFAVTIAIGLWGVWKVIHGILMAVAPKSEKGDVADQ